jgi:serine/threonine protein kinase
MVKIDLERQWQGQRPTRLEDYLRQFPELGTSETVAIELIAAECDARKLAGTPVDRGELLRRFPQRTEELQPLLKNLPLDPQRSNAAETASTGSFAQSTPSMMHLWPTAPQLQERFGRYTILRKLGGGGMGAVYLAHDTQLDRQVALKVPHFSRTDGPEIVERFYREARAAAALNHANICPVYEVGAIDGVQYLTMAYVEGQLLSDLVSPERPLGQREAAQIVARLAAAIAVAHHRGIVHRDLKPSNVMCTPSSEPVIMDFGLARRADAQDAQLTRSGSLIGTPAYMSPEQVRGESRGIGPQCDIYALGVILYELLTGRRPYQGALTLILAKILTEEPVPLAELRPDVDPHLAEICRRAMAKSQAERFASMNDLAAALQDFLRDGPSPAGKSAGAGRGPIDGRASCCLPLSGYILGGIAVVRRGVSRWLSRSKSSSINWKNRASSRLRS